jgi:hypothetical protein
MIVGNKMFSSCPYELSDSSYQYQPITLNAGVWLCIIPDVATGLDIICWYYQSCMNPYEYRILFTITLGYSIWDAGKHPAEPVPQQPVTQGQMNINTPITIGNLSQIQAFDARENDGLSRYQKSENRNFYQEQERHTDGAVPNHQHSVRSTSTGGRNTQPIHNENRPQPPATERRPVLDSRSQSSYQAREYELQSPGYERGHESVDYTSNSRPQPVSLTGRRELDEALRRAMSPDKIGPDTGQVSPKARSVKRKSVPPSPSSPQHDMVFEKEGF